MKELIKDRKGYVTNIDYQKLLELAAESKYTGKQISVLLGLHDNWLSATACKHNAIKTDVLEKLSMLLDFELDDIIVDVNKAEAKPEETKNEDGEILSELKKINQTLAELCSLLKKLDDENDKIPVSKAERAAAILRKELVGKNGGGVKYEEYKKMLIQAGIGSSYAAEAINTLDCKKFVGNNGITYIVKNDLVRV